MMSTMTNIRAFMKSCIPLLPALVFAVAACNVPLPDRMEFGVSEKIVTVPAEGGEGVIKVYSDGDIAIIPEATPKWGVITSPLNFSSDGEVRVSFQANYDLRRSVKIAVSYRNGIAADTLVFRQEGSVARFSVAEHAIFVDSGADCTTELAISTNVNPSAIDVHTRYIDEGDDWLGEIKISSRSVSFMTYGSQSPRVRKAIVTLSHEDGWGVVLKETVSVNLSNSSGQFGETLSYTQARMMAGEEGKLIEGDYLLKGIIVSDCLSNNMDMNYNTSYNVVDTTSSLKTAYIESLDGMYGFRLVFDDVADNIFRQKQIVEIMLSGKRMRVETQPQRYTISGMGVEDFKLCGTVETIPEKVRKISELTDDDVNTFVEIENTEFLDKDGCYSNVYDAYTLESPFNKTTVSNKFNSDCWPALLVDADGRTIYAMVNMMCPWRRTGGGVPQGTGPLRGILVHNDQPRYGDMGPYQIRVIDDSGYAQSRSEGSSFETLLKWDARPYKYNFSNYGDYFPYTASSNGMDTCIPSDDFDKESGACKGILSFENKMGMPMSGTKALRPCRSFQALRSNASPGGGQSDNRALSIQCNIAGFYNWNGDGSIESYNGIVSRFATEGLEGKKLFLYFSFCCGGNDNHAFKNFPSRWCVEYSSGPGLPYIVVPSMETAAPYVHLRSYGFGGPMNVDGRSYNPSYSTGMGYTEHFFEFPDDILGKEEVRVRIRPYDTKVTSIPENPADNIENMEACDGIDIYQDIRFNRIIFLIK